MITCGGYLTVMYDCSLRKSSPPKYLRKEYRVQNVCGDEIMWGKLGLMQ